MSIQKITLQDDPDIIAATLLDVNEKLPISACVKRETNLSLYTGYNVLCIYLTFRVDSHIYVYNNTNTNTNSDPSISNNENFIDALNTLIDKMNYSGSWNNKFIGLAKHISTWSHDPSTKVASVIVDEDNNIRGIGYNGFPRKVEDSPERLNDRAKKYQMIVHAEANAITSCARLGVRTEGCYMFCTLLPCSKCAGQIINAGIVKVLTLEPSTELLSRWSEDFAITKEMFKEAGVELIFVKV